MRWLAALLLAPLAGWASDAPAESSASEDAVGGSAAQDADAGATERISYEGRTRGATCASVAGNEQCALDEPGREWNHSIPLAAQPRGIAFNVSYGEPPPLTFLSVNVCARHPDELACAPTPSLAPARSPSFGTSASTRRASWSFASRRPRPFASRACWARRATARRTSRSRASSRRIELAPEGFQGGRGLVS